MDKYAQLRDAINDAYMAGDLTALMTICHTFNSFLPSGNRQDDILEYLTENGFIK